jgi:hypothetical protein
VRDKEVTYNASVHSGIPVPPNTMIHSTPCPNGAFALPFQTTVTSHGHSHVQLFIVAWKVDTLTLSSGHMKIYEFTNHESTCKYNAIDGHYCSQRKHVIE